MIAILFGIISGIITGLGVGGGAILILLLSLFFNLEQHTAQAINLVFFIPTAISAIIINAKHKNIDYKLASTIIIFGIIGAAIGAIVAQQINSYYLRKIFAVFILIIAAKEIFEIYKVYSKERKKT